MIYYGIAFDMHAVQDAGGDIDLLDENLQSGYSVSSYDPEMAIFGVRVVGGSCLFDPRSLNVVIAEANGKLTDAARGVNAAWGEGPEDLRKLVEKHSVKPAMDVYIFESTDD